MQPGQFAPRGEDWLVRRLQELELRVARNESANVFGLTGIHPKDGGTDLDGYVNVNGELTINGPATITGALSLPAGIIDNEALSSPLEVGRTSAATNGYAVTTTDQTFATATIPVPPGFTQALVFVVCNVGALNPTLVDDFLYSKAVINGVASREVFGYVANNNGSVAVTTAKSDLLTGLSGGDITCAVTVRAGTAWTSSAANRAYVEAQAIFLR